MLEKKTLRNPERGYYNSNSMQNGITPYSDGIAICCLNSEMLQRLNI